MKIVIYKDDGTVVRVIGNVVDPIIEDDSIKWIDGSIIGIKDKFAIVTDDFIVGENISDDVIDFIITQKIKVVNENVGKSCYKGFTSASTGFVFETAEHDQTNFSRRMLTVLNNPAKMSVQWKIADGSVQTLTREDFLTVCDELDEFITSKVNAGWAIKSNLRNATSLPELNDISLEVE